MKLFLVRHGETSWNKEKKFPGWESEISLTQRGQQQARLTASGLAGYSNVVSIYTSPLPRAKETAEIIAQHLGLPLLESPFLKDWNMGILTGMTARQAKSQFYQKWLTYINTPTKFSIEKGENFAQLKARLIKGLNLIVSTRHGDVIIICHADPIKIIVGLFLRMALDWIHAIQIANCSITLLQIKPFVLLERLNDTSHLKTLTT